MPGSPLLSALPSLFPARVIVQHIINFHAYRTLKSQQKALNCASLHMYVYLFTWTQYLGINGVAQDRGRGISNGDKQESNNILKKVDFWDASAPSLGWVTAANQVHRLIYGNIRYVAHWLHSCMYTTWQTFSLLDRLQCNEATLTLWRY